MTARKLNVRLLLWLLAGLVLVTPVVHAIHLLQVRRTSTDLLTRARQAQKAGDSSQALGLLKRYLSFQPQDTEALVEYGLLLAKSVEGPDSPLGWHVVHVLEQQVLQQAPERREVRRRLIQLLLDLQDWDRANKHISLLLQSEPENASLVDLRGQCQQALEEYEEAVESYRETTQLNPAEIGAYARRAFLLGEKLKLGGQAELTIAEMIECNPTSPQAWLEQSAYQGRLGQRQAAGASLEMARHLAPRDAEVLLASLRLEREGEQWDRARQFGRQGIEAHPLLVAFYIDLADLELSQDRPKEARVWLNQGLKRLPGQPDLLHLLIETHLALGELGPARDDLARLRAHSERSALAGYLEGRVLMLEKHWSKAVAVLEEARWLARPMLESAIDVALGQCHEQRGETDRRLAAFQQAFKRNQASNAAQLGLARSQLAVGQVEEALKHFQALKSKPRPPQTLWLPYAQALLLATQAQPPESRDWAELESVLALAKTPGANAPGSPAEVAVLRAEMLLVRETGPGKQKPCWSRRASNIPDSCRSGWRAFAWPCTRASATRPNRGSPRPRNFLAIGSSCLDCSWPARRGGVPPARWSLPTWRRNCRACPGRASPLAGCSCGGRFSATEARRSAPPG